MTVRNSRDLIVWQKAMDMVILIYRVSKQFPKEELYGLTSQIRRAACNSVIAEGQGQHTTGEFLHF